MVKITEYSFSPREVALLQFTIRQNTLPPLINKLVFQTLANLTAFVFYGKPQEKVCDQATAYINPFVCEERLSEWIKRNTEEYLKTIIHKEKDYYVVDLSKLPQDNNSSTPSEIIFNSICEEAGKYLGGKYLVDFDKIVKEVEAAVLFASGLNI